MLRSHNGRKTKGHCPPRPFLPFSPGPQSNDKSYHLGQIWPASRVLVYLASGLPLGMKDLIALQSGETLPKEQGDHLCGCKQQEVYSDAQVPGAAKSLGGLARR
jgi:hypothetical protein